MLTDGRLDYCTVCHFISSADVYCSRTDIHMQQLVTESHKYYSLCYTMVMSESHVQYMSELSVLWDSRSCSLIKDILFSLTYVLIVF